MDAAHSFLPLLIGVLITFVVPILRSRLNWLSARLEPLSMVDRDTERGARAVGTPCDALRHFIERENR
jgi:hypothetical protein